MTRTPLRTRAPLLLCAAAALVAAVAGCSGGDPAASPAAAGAPASVASDSPLSFDAQSLAVGRQFSQCARDHGLASFPDPLVDSGALVWPGASKADVVAAEQSCAETLRPLAALPQRVDPPSPETLAHMRQFAQCMRAHGVADWPDPKADGTFPILGTPLAGMARYATGAPQHVTDARMACREYEQEWRIAAS